MTSVKFHPEKIKTVPLVGTVFIRFVIGHPEKEGRVGENAF